MLVKKRVYVLILFLIDLFSKSQLWYVLPGYYLSLIYTINGCKTVKLPSLGRLVRQNYKHAKNLEINYAEDQLKLRRGFSVSRRSQLF